MVGHRAEQVHDRSAVPRSGFVNGQFSVLVDSTTEQHAFTHTHHSYIHTYTQYIHTYTRYIHTYIHSIHIYIHSIHTYIHTLDTYIHSIHTYIHTYTYIHTISTLSISVNTHPSSIIRHACDSFIVTLSARLGSAARSSRRATKSPRFFLVAARRGVQPSCNTCMYVMDRIRREEYVCVLDSNMVRQVRVVRL